MPSRLRGLDIIGAFIRRARHRRIRIVLVNARVPRGLDSETRDIDTIQRIGSVREADTSMTPPDPLPC